MAGEPLALLSGARSWDLRVLPSPLLWASYLRGAGPRSFISHPRAASDKLRILFSCSSIEFNFIHVYFQRLICRTLIITAPYLPPRKTKPIFPVILPGACALFDAFQRPSRNQLTAPREVGRKVLLCSYCHAGETGAPRGRSAWSGAAEPSPKVPRGDPAARAVWSGDGATVPSLGGLLLPPPPTPGCRRRCSWSGRQAGREEIRENLLRTPELSAGWIHRHGLMVEHLPGAAAPGTRSRAGPRAVLGAFGYLGAQNGYK